MKRYIFALLCLAIASAAGALEVDITAGGLRDAVEHPAEVAALTVRGTMDASDFDFIATDMDALTRLDLSGATVAAYNGEPLQGLRNFEADVLPPVLLAGTAISEITLPGSLVAIGDCALAGTSLSAVALPSTLVRVGSGAFAGCNELTTVASACANLGDGAFASCSGLASVSLAPDTRLGARTFADCPALCSVQGSADVAVIGDDAFAGCSALSVFSFGEALCSLGARAFSGSGLEMADLSGCSRLTSVGPAAFSGCPALKALILPEGCDVAQAHALALNSPGLTEVNMPVEAIPAYALASSPAVNHIALAGKLEQIGDHAMAGMTGLRSIDATALRSVPELGAEVWRGVNQGDVLLTAAPGMGIAFLSASQWQEFEIDDGSVGIDDAPVPEAPGVSARFIGAMLHVRCTGAPVRAISVSDIEGRVLATLVPDADGMAALDTSAWATDIYLLVANGPEFRATLKLVRTN